MRIVLRLALVCALAIGVAPGASAAEKSVAAPSKSQVESTRTPQSHAKYSRQVRSAEKQGAKFAPGVRALASAPSTTSVIVGFEPGGSAKAVRASVERGAKVTKRAKSGTFCVVRVPAGTDVDTFVEEMSAQPGVDYVEPNGLVRAAVIPNDPSFLTQWGLTKIGAPTAWDSTRGSGVTVAVVDSGVYYSHEDLTGRVDTSNDYDFVNNDADAADDNDHGTHVAGILAATMNNGLGAAGVANLATILPVKVLDSDGWGTYDQIADGIRYAGDRADVINLSVGGGYSYAINEAVQYAVSKDCVVVAASGNNDGAYVNYPGACANVIAVGSTDVNDTHSSFSNYGPQVDVCAPGSAIYSTVKSGGYETFSGTSMATPHTAGVVALIRALHPSWTRTQVENQLLGSVEDLGAAGKDDQYGYGRVDAAAAVGAAVPPPVESDNNIPGVALPASPVAGSLDAGTDKDDVYRVFLKAGERLTLSLAGEPGTDFDMYLFDPEAVDAATDPWIAGAYTTTYPESMKYVARASGYYYIDLYADLIGEWDAGSGPYTLTWDIQPPSTGPDDDIPGAAAPASPITGALEFGVDVNDVYAIDLTAGETLSVSLEGVDGTDFDAFLYGPDATSVWKDDAVAVAGSAVYPDDTSYRVENTGTHYLRIHSYSGSGGYTATYTVSAADPDYDVPGTPLATSPQTGTLSATDTVDVYSVHASAGQTISLRLDGAAGTDFDLSLYDPSAASVHTTEPVAWSYKGTYPDEIRYTALITGDYYIKLDVWDGEGEYSLAYVVRAPAAPVAEADHATVIEDTTLMVDAPGVLANDTDANWDQLTAEKVEDPSHGTLVLDLDGSYTYTPAAGYKGGDSFTYRAKDPGGLYSAAVAVNITVASATDVPEAVSDSATVNEDAVLTVDAPGVLANDSDPNGDAIGAVLVSLPANGTLVLDPDGSYTYTPDADYAGDDSFDYRVQDDTGLYSEPVSVSITVTAVPDAPVAAADSGVVAEDTALSAPAPGVLSNDHDADGDSFTAEKLAGPSHGALTLGANGSYIYMPSANYNGPDSFTYRVVDSTGRYSAPATVSMTVSKVNDAPVAGADAYIAAEDTVLSVAANGVLANDSDVDQDALTAVALIGPTHGTLSLNANGSFTYAPAANFHGADSFAYWAQDGSGWHSNAVAVSITVTPVIDGTAFSVTSASATLASYGAPYTLTGTLTSGGAPLVGKMVSLQYASSASGPWTTSSIVALTGANGSYSLSATPRYKTYYRAHFVGDTEYGASPSDVRYALPRPYVSAPKAPKTISKSKYYTVYGYLKPKHTSGTYPVRIYKYKKTASGKWKSYSYVKAKATTYTSSTGAVYTKYSRKIRLPYAGKWRLRAYAPADSKHASKWSTSYDYVTVK